MNVLVVDVGGTYIKIFAAGQKEPRRFSPGPTMTPRQMVSGVKKLAVDWQCDVVSIGSRNWSSVGVRLPLPDLGDGQWRLQDLLGDAAYEREGDNLLARGLYLDEPSWKAAVFSLTMRNIP